MKRFNIDGMCVLDRDYIANIDSKLDKMCALADSGRRFALTYPNGFGKSTVLSLLEKRLRSNGIVISFGFDGLDNAVFGDERKFVQAFLLISGQLLRTARVNDDLIDEWESGLGNSSLLKLKYKIRSLSAQCGRPVFLLLDDADKGLGNQVYMDFIHLLSLRAQPTPQHKLDTITTIGMTGMNEFKSIILSGSNEIPGWARADELGVDMALTSEEIASMLFQYEEEHLSGMDIKQVSETIRTLTDGRPLFVSALCREVDAAPDRKWIGEDLIKAAQRLSAIYPLPSLTS